jgi:hypothetical protein
MPLRKVSMTNATLRRYTALPSLIHILKYRQLTLLNPSSWDDKNDSHFLSLYREKRKLKSVLALCFAQASETYHHWRVFAPGSAGVCLQFDSDAVKTAVSHVPGAKVKPVEYLTLPEIRKGTIKTARLPFLKRFAFKPENEVRILWESKTAQRSELAVPVELAAVQRITLSPWLHPSLADEVKALIKTIDGCSKLKVYRSTLIGNEEWMRCGSSAS